MDWINSYYGWCFFVDIEKRRYELKENRLPKFEKDKIYVDTQDILLLIDGVIFNIKELILEEKVKTWEECVTKIAGKDVHFFSRFRGSFNGLYLDKKNGICYIFGDQIGTHPLFYYKNEQFFIATSNFNYLYEFMKEKNIIPQLNEMAVKYMLSFGAMIDKSTYYKGVFRLLGGECLEYQLERKRYVVSKYFEFDNESEKFKSEEEILEALDKSFKKAIEREFEKDKEYGLRSLVDISGGMDSRMVCFGAKERGYTNILNICMSQMNAVERKVAEQNVKLLGFDYVFSSLDNANFIYDIDEIVKLNYGLAYVASVTGALKNIKMLKTNELGIHHTGILGDIHDGSFVEDDVQKKPSMDGNKYYMSKINKFEFSEFNISQYKNQEMYLFNTRGILFGLTSNLIRQSVTETFSPFCDVEFLNTFFGISLHDRVSKKILQKWVIERYSDANKVVYGNTGARLGVNLYYRKVKSLFRRIKNEVLKPMLYKCHIPVDITPQNSMNPFEYWYNTIPDFKEFINEYYVKNMPFLMRYPEVKIWCEKMYLEGKVVDKFLAMTVISVVKQYFNGFEE